jgi:hypothetical protein
MPMASHGSTTINKDISTTPPAQVGDDLHGWEQGAVDDLADLGQHAGRELRAVAIQEPLVGLPQVAAHEPRAPGVIPVVGKAQLRPGTQRPQPQREQQQAEEEQPEENHERLRALEAEQFVGASEVSIGLQYFGIREHRHERHDRGDSQGLEERDDHEDRQDQERATAFLLLEQCVELAVYREQQRPLGQAFAPQSYRIDAGTMR